MNNHENRYETAHALIEHMKNDHGMEISVPIGVELIAENLGIKIEYTYIPEPTEIVGGIFFRGDHPVITVNLTRNNYPPRKRFTIAHEIAHYCLHSNTSRIGFQDSSRSMSRTESYWDTTESEANSFAAQLLMPKQQIFDIGREIIDNYKEITRADKIPAEVLIQSMADRFLVSSKAMEYRLKNLQVVRN